MIEPGSKLYRFLVWFAIGTALFVVGSMVYQYMMGPDDGAVLHYRRANMRLEDGQFKEALTDFNEYLKLVPGKATGYLGKGLALMGLNQFNEALEAIEVAIQIDPKLGAAWANKGILLDRIGRHREALDHYNKALQLDRELSEGPGWLTRFFRSQWEKPPSIADRARYLETELAKPETERLLRIPEKDSEQRSYTYDGK